jgi:ferritin-like metal-binding protein YciE
MSDAADLLAATLQEELQTGEELNALADKQVNQEAMSEDGSGAAKSRKK